MSDMKTDGGISATFSLKYEKNIFNNKLSDLLDINILYANNFLKMNANLSLQTSLSIENCL